MSSNSERDSPPPTLINIGKTNETITLNNNENTDVERYMWRSCCLVVDRRAVIFFSQLSISISIIIFCMMQLWIHHDDCDKNQLYTGILMTIVGVHLPQPKMRK
jgi:hypothetical protein